MPRKPRSDEYERIGDKADRGEFTLVDPLDYLILDHLNPEGETFAGLYPLAHTARQINDQALGGAMDMLVLGNRFTSLKKQKLVVHVNTPGSGGNIAYQKTARGAEVVRAWKQTREVLDGNA